MDKEFEKLKETFYRIAEILILRSSIYLVTNELKLRDKVIIAIFYDCLITIMFNKFGKEKEREVMLGVISSNESIDQGKISFSAEHINIARKLVQLEKDSIAIEVAKSAANVWSDIDNISKNEAALYDILVDKSIDWNESSLVVENVIKNENNISQEKLKHDNQETLDEIEKEDKDIKIAISEEKVTEKQSIDNKEYETHMKNWDIFLKYRPEVEPLVKKLKKLGDRYELEFIYKVLNISKDQRNIENLNNILNEIEEGIYTENIGNMFSREELNILHKKLYDKNINLSKKLLSLIDILGEDVNLKKIESHITSKGINLETKNLSYLDQWNILIDYKSDLNNLYLQFLKILDLSSRLNLKNINLEEYKEEEFHKIITSNSKSKKTPKQIFYEGHVYNYDEGKSFGKEYKSTNLDIIEKKYIYVKELIFNIIHLNPSEKNINNISDIFQNIIFYIVRNGHGKVYNNLELNELNKIVSKKNKSLFIKLKGIIDITGEDVDIESLKKDLNII